jgi:hypothetical protein
MKKTNVKKLQLRKNTVSNLSEQQSVQILGGAATVTCPTCCNQNTCAATCPATCANTCANTCAYTCIGCAETVGQLTCGPRCLLETIRNCPV